MAQNKTPAILTGNCSHSLHWLLQPCEWRPPCSAVKTKTLGVICEKALQINSWENKQTTKEKRKLYPIECRTPEKQQGEIRKPSMKQRKTTEWGRDSLTSGQDSQGKSGLWWMQRPRNNWGKGTLRLELLLFSIFLTHKNFVVIFHGAWCISLTLLDEFRGEWEHLCPCNEKNYIPWSF